MSMWATLLKYFKDYCVKFLIPKTNADDGCRRCRANYLTFYGNFSLSIERKIFVKKVLL